MDTQQYSKTFLVKVSHAIYETVRECGQVPSGHLYAGLQGAVDLQTFQFLMDTLVRIGLVKIDGSHLVTYTGPSK